MAQASEQRQWDGMHNIGCENFYRCQLWIE